MECIILAGGLGTRLRSSIGDYPKCMAPVNGKPFLHYLFAYLRKQNCHKVILSLGYRYEVIVSWLQHQELPFQVDYVIEREPLGTGGGILLALDKADENDVAVLNGDTFFDVDMEELHHFHTEKQSAVSIALKRLHHFERYGSVQVDNVNAIIAFEEKKPKNEGLINGGVYIIDKACLISKNLPERFSFEKDYLEAFVGDKQFFGQQANGYFIDIGIPEDYQQAQSDFKELF